MGRILKRKPDNQKIKLKNKLKQKNELNPSADDSNDSSEMPAAKEVLKRIIPQKKTDETKKTSIVAENSYYQKASQFLREVKAELKKVVWPPKNQTIASTIVVIILVIIVSSFLGLFDLFLKWILQMILH